VFTGRLSIRCPTSRTSFGGASLAPEPRVWNAVRAEVARLARLADDLQGASRAEERQFDVQLIKSDPATLIAAARAAASVPPNS
jgi:tRNA-dihydrouridine synthase